MNTKKHMILKVWILVFLLVASKGYTQEAQHEMITIYSYQTHNMEAQATPSGIELVIQPGQKGYISMTPEDTYWDLTQWVFLSLELENRTGQEVRFEPEILYDNPRRSSNIRQVNNKHIGFLHPMENLVYNCVLIRDQINAPDYPQVNDFPGMKGMPDGVILNFAGIDARHIKAFNLAFPEQDFERRVVLKRLFKNRPALPELYMEDKEAFFPFINEYGQYKHATWEGKITDDSQFADAIIKEEKDLQAYPGSNEWNRFGGFAKGPRFEATGHFRTQKIDSKWWIIDPDGYLFWSAGVNSAGKLEVHTPFHGREHFFEGMPEKNNDNQILFTNDSYKYGLANLYRKYGANSEGEYVAVSLKRMKSWGLNTMGGWSVETVGQHPEKIRIPYTVYINAISPAINDKFPDVFDPLWKADVERMIKEKAALVKDDPWFFGFFINNEIHWGTPYSLANHTLSKDGSSAGKKVYIDLLRQHFDSINAFNKATGAAFKSWNELLNTEITRESLNMAALRTINEEHYTHMCEVYFKTTKDLIDTYAPGKMYLGCRWHGNHKNQINMSVAARYLDILSFNAYENEVEFYPYPPESIDKPFMITEFNFGALDSGKFFTGLGYASDQRNRGEKYQNFIKGALRNPRCVGAHWFMWANSTTAGRGNGENANCGLVSKTDQIYYELISYMRIINYQLYQYRVDN